MLNTVLSSQSFKNVCMHIAGLGCSGLLEVFYVSLYFGVLRNARTLILE